MLQCTCMLLLVPVAWGIRVLFLDAWRCVVGVQKAAEVGAAAQAAYGRLPRFKTELAAAVAECDRKGGAVEDVDVEPLEREALEGGEGDDWLLVTRPTQLAAVDGHLRLRRGLDKSTLPGFAELNPGGRNALYVLYKFNGTFYELEGAAPPFPFRTDLAPPHCCVCKLGWL